MRYFFENTKAMLTALLGTPSKITPAGECVWEFDTRRIAAKRSHVFCYDANGGDTRDKVIIGFSVPYDQIDSIDHTGVNPGDEGLLVFKDGNGFEIGAVKSKRKA